jgi:hypothetical protein
LIGFLFKVKTLEAFLQSDFEVITEILKKYPGTTAREIAQYAVSIKVVNSQVESHLWDKGRVNSTLYKMLVQNLVKKETRGGPRPFWVLSESTESDIPHPKVQLATNANNALSHLPLKAINDYQQVVQGRTIQIALNGKAASNDLYISCDWLEDRIFVAININHPYIKNLVTSDSILLEFLRFLAIDAYTEWRIIMNSQKQDFISLIRIRDKALRDF